MAKLGKSLNLTNKQLDKLAEITKDDISRTNDKWIKAVPSIIKNLLIAEKE